MKKLRLLILPFAVRSRYPRGRSHPELAFEKLPGSSRLSFPFPSTSAPDCLIVMRFETTLEVEPMTPRSRLLRTFVPVAQFADPVSRRSHLASFRSASGIGPRTILSVPFAMGVNSFKVRCYCRRYRTAGNHVDRLGHVADGCSILRTNVRRYFDQDIEKTTSGISFAPEKPDGPFGLQVQIFSDNTAAARAIADRL